jgi:hypothetical protein
MVSQHDAKIGTRDVRRRLNGWDPARLIAAGAPEDEYDCLSGPLFRLLTEDAPADDIAAFIETEIASHFGVHCPSAFEFARELKSSYRSSRRAPY